MKKIIALLLVMAFAVALCACGEDDIRGKIEDTSKDKSTDVSSADASSTSSEDSSADNSEASDATSEDATSEDVTSDESSQAPSDEKELELGNVSGSAYVSDFIGVRYNLDDGWFFYNDEQIKTLNNFAQDLVGDELAEAIKNANIIYDMYATEETQLNNVIINLEKVNPIQLTLLDLKENLKNTIPSVKDGLAAVGYSNINGEVIEIEVDGKTVDAIRITAEIYGVKMYQIMFQKKCSGYLACMGVTTMMEDNTAALLDNFQWID